MARQNKEGRVVPLDVFIDDYFLAKGVVNEIKLMFPSEVSVDLIIGDYLNKKRKIYINISNIDSYLTLPYNKKTLKEKLIKIISN